MLCPPTIFDRTTMDRMEGCMWEGEFDWKGTSSCGKWVSPAQAAKLTSVIASSYSNIHFVGAYSTFKKHLWHLRFCERTVRNCNSTTYNLRYPNHQLTFKRLTDYARTQQVNASMSLVASSWSPQYLRTSLQAGPSDLNSEGSSS
jgi:hypothetical protein